MAADELPIQSGSVEEVTFSLSDPAYPFVGLSATADCAVELARMLPRDGDRYAEYFHVAGASPETVLELAAAFEAIEATCLLRRADGGLFEFVVSAACPARSLAERGALPTVVKGVEGRGRIVVEILPSYDASEIVGEFLEAEPDASLVAKRTKDHPVPLFTRREVEAAIEVHLTDRQREVLRTAFEMGYYDRPRETTGDEIADDLGISSSTFSQHIRAAERNVLGLLYEEEF